MIIEIDPDRPEPPYQQIRRQVLAGLSRGDLPAGARLPTIRQLARDLDLAVNTVARAYRELEADGVIETRGRRGSFVRPSRAGAGARAQALALDEVVAACVAEARRLGAGPSDISAAVARALSGGVGPGH